MEENEAIENDPIIQKLRETKCKKAVKFFKNMSSCLWKPDLLISHAFCIFLYGSFGAITPYLPLYFKQYNLVPYQVGVILGLSPIIQCLVSPVWTALAGKWHAQKLVFLAGVLSLLVKLLLFLAVQPHKQYCLESYINSTSNVSYERSMPYSDVLKGVEKKWKANKPAVSNKKALKTTAATKRDVHYDDPEDMAIEELPNYNSISHQSRHIMAIAMIVRSGSSSDVVIKKSSNWDSHLNATINSTITGDKDEVFDIFLIFVLFVVVCDFLQAPTFGLGDGSVFNRLQDNFISSPTKMHLTGSLGWVCSALIIGAIIYGSKALHCGSTYLSYYVAFYFSIAFVCMAFTHGLWFEYIYDNNSQDSGCETWKKSCKIFGTIKNFVFLICLLYVSLSSGFLVSFLNWYIDDLGGSSLVMATVSSTRVIVIFIFYQFAKTLVPILGKSNVSLVAMMCYTSCFFCFWLARNTWEIVAIVAIEGSAFGLVWRCCDHFVSHLQTSTNVASLTKGLLEALFWGVGQGLGAIIGGALYGWLGKQTFCVLGVATIAILLILVGLLYYKSFNTDDDIDIEDYEIIDDDKSTKVRYDDYEDMDDDRIKHDSDGEESNDDDDDNHEIMNDGVDDKPDHVLVKEVDDGDYFKFATADSENGKDYDGDEDITDNEEAHHERPGQEN